MYVIGKGHGLRSLSKTLLGINMDKNQAIRRGDWGAAELNPQQIEYAAIDAWVG